MWQMGCMLHVSLGDGGTLDGVYLDWDEEAALAGTRSVDAALPLLVLLALLTPDAALAHLFLLVAAASTSPSPSSASSSFSIFFFF